MLRNISRYLQIFADISRYFQYSSLIHHCKLINQTYKIVDLHFPDSLKIAILHGTHGTTVQGDSGAMENCARVNKKYVSKSS